MKLKQLLILILITSFIIRLPGLNQSLWLDEAIQAQVSTNLTFTQIFTNFLPGDFNPPLHYIFTWVFANLFSNSEFILRLPSVISGVAIVYFLYLISKELKLPKKAQLQLTALIATAPLLIYYSQEARAYSLAAATTSLSFYYLLKLHNSKKPTQNNYLKYWISTGLMLFSHYLTWLMLPVHLFILLLNKKSKKIILNSFLPLTFWLLIALPVLIPQIQTGFNVSSNLPVWQNLNSFSLKQLALIPIKFLIDRLPVENTASYGILLGTPLISGLLITLYALTKKDKKSKQLVISILWLTIPIIIGALVSFKLSIFNYFRFLFLVPAFYLTLIISAQKLPKIIQNYIFAAFLAINLISTGFYLFNSDYHREDWHSVAEYTNTKSLKTPVIIISVVNSPYQYYDQDKHQLTDYSEIAKIANQPMIWLIKYSQPIFDPLDKTEQTLTTIYGYETVEEKHFRGDIIVKLLVNRHGLQATNL